MSNLIIATDTIWKNGTVIELAQNIQIANGVELTIEPGVIVNGNNYSIQTYGTLNVLGTSTDNVELNQTWFFFGTDHKNPGEINIHNAIIKEGAFLPANGASSYGAFSVSDSSFVGVRGFYIWYPTSTSSFENNYFYKSDGLSIGLSGVEFLVKNNVFLLHNGPAVTNWASYGGVNLVVEENSFLSTDRRALELSDGYSSSAMIAQNNYFGTNDINAIAERIFDQTDSLSSASIIEYLPVLNNPHPNAPVLNFALYNSIPTGWVFIYGAATQGRVLTAFNTLADIDGLGAITYQWRSNGSNISGATGSSFILTQAEVGKVITVVASYTDQFGTAESVVSGASAPVANINDAATGSVAISGAAHQGQVLTASNTLADIDGLGTITYQWRSNGSNINGATGSTYTLTQAEVGKAITVVASYKDQFRSAESVESIVTASVVNVNDDPTGLVSISGTATQGQILTASNTLADIDGLGAITYQWRSNGSNISGATGSSFTLTKAEVGKAITVVASYTDRLGSAESVVSSDSQPVVELINDNISNTLIGGSSNDTFINGLANDLIIGGDGLDYVSFSGNAKQYIFALTPEGSIEIRDSVANRNGTDLLTGIERLQFSDINIALDISGTAGKAYRIYEAVLGRAPDLKGLGYWINDMDNGVSLTTIAQGFIASPEFQGKYGSNPSFETYINLLYNNILDRAPDTEGINYWISNMQKGIDTPAAVLASFSEGYENTANVAPDIANGIFYAPWMT